MLYPFSAVKFSNFLKYLHTQLLSQKIRVQKEFSRKRVSSVVKRYLNKRMKMDEWQYVVNVVQVQGLFDYITFMLFSLRSAGALNDRRDEDISPNKFYYTIYPHYRLTPRKSHTVSSSINRNYLH